MYTENKTIYSTKEFEIQQTYSNHSTHDKNIFYIFFQKESSQLIKSMLHTKLIAGITITDNYSTLKIKCESIQSFSQYREYLKKQKNSPLFSESQILRCIYTLSKQIEYLLNTNIMIYGFNTENIIIIDQSKFFFLSNDFLTTLNHKSEMININSPFLKDNNCFLSPEILNIKSIPCKIHYKSIYYSLAAFVIYCLTDTNILDEIPIDVTEIIKKEYEEEINSLMKPIEGSKLYSFLKRCLSNNPEKRSLLYI